jgi:insulysin
MEQINKTVYVLKPKIEQRDIIGGKLNNGVKYILIHDEHLEKSYVTVTINVGSYSNPKSYDGLAHFLEHMLFMGSSKYPDENHYQTKLNEYGGYSNAYTDTMQTVYYFNVYDQGLGEIIDIFSRFFIDPLFDPDCVSRELNAVDSEHRKNINSDYWRKFQLMLYLTDPESVTNTFITGSLNTLSKPDIREKMIDFYKTYYTTDNISICIGSSKKPDELFNIIDKTFGSIKKSICEKPLNISKPFVTKSMGKTYYLKSISNIYEITYIWEIPHQFNSMKTKEFLIIENILTDTSENSLSFYLKNKGYLSYINTEIKYEGLFLVKFKLTKEGFENMDLIEKAFLQTLNQILKQDLKALAEYYQKINRINFDYLNKVNMEDLCNFLSVNHHLTETLNVFEFDLAKEIKSNDYYQKLFQKYLNPENVVRIISSQNFWVEDLKYKKLFEYDGSYAEIKKLTFPKNNVFDIATKLCCEDLSNSYFDIKPHVIKDLDRHEVPILIGERQWYGAVSKFGEPSVKMLLQLNNNKYFKTPQNNLLTNMTCSILNLLSRTILNKPLKIGYWIFFENRSHLSCINLNISGLNDLKKLKMFIKDLNDFLLNLEKHFEKLDRTFIDNLIVSTHDSLKNIYYLNPWEYSTYLIRNDIYSTEYSIEELLEDLKTIDYDMIKNYLVNLLDETALTTFVYGNIESNELDNLFTPFKKYFTINSYPYPKIEILSDKTIIHPNPIEKSNCLTYLYPLGQFVPLTYILIGLTNLILSQLFFDDLRTKHQLGYLVTMGFNIYRDDYFMVQKIQSEKDIKIVEDLVEKFNMNMVKQIEKANFETFVQTLRNQISESDYSLDEKYERYYPEITLRKYLFNRKEKLLEQLNKVTKSDIIKFVKEYINPNNRIRYVIEGN